MSDIHGNFSLLIKHLRNFVQDSLNVSQNETIRNVGNLLVPLHELWSFAVSYIFRSSPFLTFRRVTNIHFRKMSPVLLVLCICSFLSFNFLKSAKICVWPRVNKSRSPERHGD